MIFKNSFPAIFIFVVLLLSGPLFGSGKIGFHLQHDSYEPTYQFTRPIISFGIYEQLSKNLIFSHWSTYEIFNRTNIKKTDYTTRGDFKILVRPFTELSRLWIGGGTGYSHETQLDENKFRPNYKISMELTLW